MLVTLVSAYGQNFFSNCVLLPKMWLVTWENFVNNLFTEMNIQKEFPSSDVQLWNLPGALDKD